MAHGSMQGEDALPSFLNLGKSCLFHDYYKAFAQWCQSSGGYLAVFKSDTLVSFLI